MKAEGWTGQSHFFSVSVSLPKVIVEFCEKARKSISVFYLFWFCFFCCCLFCPGLHIFFPFIYVSELSNQLHREIYLNIIVNGSERSRTFNRWGFSLLTATELFTDFSCGKLSVCICYEH